MIGGGFIGSEVAAALNTAGCKVTLVVPEAGIGARLFPADLAESVNELYRGHGVEVLPGELVSAVERGRRRLLGPARERADARGGRRRRRASASSPRPSSPRRPASRSTDGIVVDEYGRAGGTGDVYAAGDVARFPSKVLGTDIRVEHEDHANSHGRAVGANMAGADEPYTHLPFFYSDLFELGYEAVGEVDSRRETLAEWSEPLRKGVVGYLGRGRPAARASCSSTRGGRSTPRPR